MTAASLLFWVFAAATCFGAVAVVVSQNVVRMAFWLILSLGSTAGLFFLLQADFVATAQLLVYVGGTLVLLIFGVMLTASGPFVSMRTKPGEAVMAAVVAAALIGLLFSSVGAVDWPQVVAAVAGKEGFNPETPVTEGYNLAGQGSTTRAVGLALMGPRVDRDLGTTKPVLSSGYLFPFEIASIHLLVVLIGAAYLARAKRRVSRDGSSV